MANVEALGNQLTQARNELNNLRKKMQAMRAQHQKDVSAVRRMLEDRRNEECTSMAQSSNLKGDHCQSRHFSKWKPIGHLQTWFHNKNGTPRQGSVSSLSRGVLCIGKDVFNNPQHSLEGLQEYSHVWVFFVFDQNEEGMKGSHSKSKVAPPRLNGERKGVFATRSPHRPNPLGLTLARLEKVEGNCLHLSGLDILNGTPVVDIKPYIPEYDSPHSFSSLKERLDSEDMADVSSHRITLQTISDYASKSKENPNQRTMINDIAGKTLPDKQMNNSSVSEESQEELKCCTPMECHDLKVKVEDGREDMKCSELGIQATEEESNSDLMSSMDADVTHPPEISKNSPSSAEVKTADWVKVPPLPTLEVIFNPLAERQIKSFSANPEDETHRLRYLKSDLELQSAISAILGEDPRSSYRRKKCSSSLYYFTVDTAHVTAWFDGNIAEVLRVRPLSSDESAA